MKLMTKTLEAALLKAFIENLSDPVPLVKFFTVWAPATWLICRAEKIDGELIMHGLCDLGMGCPEFGPVLLSELEGLKGPCGLKVERNLYWKAGGTIMEYADAANELGRIVELHEWKQSKKQLTPILPGLPGGQPLE